MGQITLALFVGLLMSAGVAGWQAVTRSYVHWLWLVLVIAFTVAVVATV